MDKMDEKILAIPRAYLFNNEEDVFQGVLVSQNPIRKIIERCESSIEVRRGDVEDDEYFKQVIPYTVIRRGHEVFIYKRLEKGGEARLHNQLSLGVGGHMNHIPEAQTWVEMLVTNALREIEEEVEITKFDGIDLNLLGILNDDAGDAGLYHVGILFILDVPLDSEVTVLETDQLEGYWITLAELLKPELFEQLESWSKMAFAGVVRHEREKYTALTK